MLTRLTRLQLSIFAVVTVLTVTAISAFYLHVPAALGIGTYNVTANFVAGGGLYQNANVTYRGVTIGRVEEVGLTDDGVIAKMRLNTDTDVPANVTATVKSVSAVGEQYIDLVPPEGSADAQLLRNGSHIGVDRTAIGQDIAGLLKQADDLVSSVGDARIQDLLSETFKAFNGSGPELARLIQSGRDLVDEANAAYPETAQLIDQAGPFLDAQIEAGDDIRSTADGLARLTAEVADADPQLRSVLQTVPGAAAEANTTFEGIRPTFPVLAANLANFGRIGVIYNKSIEQALVIFPALIAALNTVAGGVPADEGGKLDFKVDLGDSPPCLTGFIPSTEIRSPADTTLRELPTDLYCKTAQNDPAVVRGARNYPCQEFPGKRAPTVQLCRDPVGYVPIGSNPWRGPPVPYDTPITDPRNITPPNKFPNIPPEADYDPGAPAVQLPPGVQPGPGPAPNAPFPNPVPPNNNAPAPPWPFYAPPDHIAPPYGRQVPPAPGEPIYRPPGSQFPGVLVPPGAPLPPGVPAPPPPVAPPAPAPGPLPAEQPLASASLTTTYDPKTGVFADPTNGGTGVFAPGSDVFTPAENWVDLMMAPRQM
ncbi:MULTISPECIES: MCE family protein [Mycolicibacterium]|uniref:Mammalian cell entry protein n=1 Tax=Mycolicibacterium bacteremicum TaxID=564198 RepID=A0A1W9YW32_MYCBA|nr:MULTISPECIES: MCE family protein [Mycolicibacterium]MCV7430432.1 MCE family protein [Mycolicibacterium bacteremicum]ORA04264.1 mammalian cell entry protein [Mycolicibacterium bacteremicum]QVI29036.1 MCE family protein [Mycolicibacterium neoaurum]